MPLSTCQPQFTLTYRQARSVRSDATTRTYKILRDGKVYIIHNGRVFSVSGAEIK